MFEKEIQTNQQFFTEPRLAPDVTPDPDGHNEPSDFTKSVIEPKLNLEVDFRTDGKLGESERESERELRAKTVRL